MTYTPLDIKKLHKNYSKKNTTVDYIFVGISMFTIFVFSILVVHLIQKSGNISMLPNTNASMR